jgi:hypothetical protein
VARRRDAIGERHGERVEDGPAQARLPGVLVVPVRRQDTQVDHVAGEAHPRERRVVALQQADVGDHLAQPARAHEQPAAIVSRQAHDPRADARQGELQRATTDP